MKGVININKTCFVIMGFGKKQRPLKYEIINHDAVYNKLIKPAIEKAGYLPIRSDEIKSNELIPTKFFTNLKLIDIVIADISALNANAMYELGVRHSLRAYSTLIIKDDMTPYPFDISTNSIITYSSKLTSENIAESIEKIYQGIKSLNNNCDSPVFTFMNNTLSTQENFFGLHKIINTNEILNYINNDDFANALLCFENSSLELSNYDVKTLYAFCRYKLNEYSAENLQSVYTYLIDNNLDTINDTETLCLFGAILKRLWKITGIFPYLENAIEFYKRSYYASLSFYPGSNLAYLLLEKAIIEKNEVQKKELLFSAKYFYREIIKDCEKNILTDEWAIATLKTCFFVLGEIEQYYNYSKHSDLEIQWKNKSESNQFLRIKEIINDLKPYL